MCGFLVCVGGERAQKAEDDTMYRKEKKFQRSKCKSNFLLQFISRFIQRSFFIAPSTCAYTGIYEYKLCAMNFVFPYSKRKIFVEGLCNYTIRTSGNYSVP